jgi:Leucine-rich repeat (LRR) protein
VLLLRANEFTEFSLPAELSGLIHLDVSKNPLTQVSLPADLSELVTLRLSENQLNSLTLPPGMIQLTALNLSLNQLTNVVLPPDLGQLETLNLGGNLLTSFTVPAGLTNLTGLFLTGNQLTNITLPGYMTKLSSLGFLGNPLATLVLSQPLAVTSMAEELVFVQSQGVSVFTYPLEIQLVEPRTPVGAFQFGIVGPPGVYAVLASTNLALWNQIGITTNNVGSVRFTDTTAHFSEQKFYRVRSL